MGLEIGIWPSKFFTGLANFATYIEWGGEVYSPSHIPSPEMGTGAPVSNHDQKCSAMCCEMTLVNEEKKIVPAMSLVKYEDINKHYQIVDKGYVGDNLQHVMFYGGKGGYIGN
ncbi:hypothetical protein M5689_019572 [Euphorbia peplus]|nr:hypothetical protein M5689_019572 [Euphorbia peplus]